MLMGVILTKRLTFPVFAVFLCLQVVNLSTIIIILMRGGGAIGRLIFFGLWLIRI